MTKSAILCVDDERAILLSLREQIFRNFGDLYCYEIAETVEEAWEIIEELHEDNTEVIVIISDWLMPGIKGDEFLIEVHRRFPNVVTVLLTGQANESAVTRLRQYANLYAYLSKPWNEATLIDTIQSGLEKLHL